LDVVAFFRPVNFVYKKTTWNESRIDFVDHFFPPVVQLIHDKSCYSLHD
jgi:hypothetical protein